MRFRRPFKKPGEPRGSATPVAGVQNALDVPGAIGNRAIERGLKNGGQPLPGSTRAQMEASLGGNFKDVRVQTDSNAARRAQNEGARAFTEGSNIVFDRDQYHPGTPAGDALIAHELAHVKQQRGATTIGHETPALEADASKAAVGGLSAFFGGMRARLAGAGPALRSGLAVQRCSCGGAQKLPAKGAPGKAAAKGKAADSASQAKSTPDPLAAEKASLAKAFGFSRVADGSEKWTAADLAKVRRILGQIPNDAKAAIQGVALLRETKPNCPGGEPAGCFRSIVNPTTGEREDVIEIGDDAFKSDKDFDKKEQEKSGVKSRRMDASGAEITALPSEDVVAHEVGHALETALTRKAESARVKADIAVTPKHKALSNAIGAFTIPGVAGISNASAAELTYTGKLVDVSKSLTAVNKQFRAIPDEPKASELTASKKAVEKLKPNVKKAIAERDKAKAKLPAGSSAVQSTVEAGQNAALTAIDDILKAMQELIDVQKVLEAAEAAEAATKTKAPGGPGGGKMETSRRLAEVVAIVAIKKIDVKNSGALGQYPKDHWPHEPGELYADLFQMSLTEPGGLKLFDPDIAAYFSQPIGVKSADLKKKVEAWIAKQNK